MYPNLDLVRAVMNDRERRLKTASRSHEALLIRKEQRAKARRQRGLRVRDPLKA